MRRIRAFAYELKIWLFDASFNPAVGWLLSAAAYCGFLGLRRVRRENGHHLFAPRSLPAVPDGRFRHQRLVPEAPD